MTFDQALKQGTQKLEGREISTGSLDVQVLLEFVTGHTRSYLLAHPSQELNKSQIKQLNQLITKRAKHVPIAHLTGHKEFYGLDFKVSSQVLSPRPESEKIVELAIKLAPKSGQLLDMGTGSGALAIAIAKSRPDLAITASDISPAALKIAKRNAADHAIKINFQLSDLFGQIHEQFDVIVANLPYVPAEDNLNADAKHEPRTALLGGKDGFEIYRKFFESVTNYLNPGGYIIIESDPWQQSQLAQMARSARLSLVEQDYFVSGFQL